jgi:hypothetical protein
MPPVISNTGPLIALADIGQLELLHHLFNNILIPPAVRAEVVNEPALAAVQTAIAQGCIVEQRPSDTGAIRLLNETLDLGESEAIALAQPTAPRWIILDDLAARHVAEAMGLPVTPAPPQVRVGTLGVLLLAKEAGHLTEIKPLLDRLCVSSTRESGRRHHHFRLAKHVHKVPHQRDRFALVSGVVVHLAAAGLFQGKVHRVTQPFQQPHGGLPGGGEERVAKAGDEK